MKIKGNVTGALISLAVFLAFAIAGGICLAAGIGELAQNTGAIEKLENIAGYFGDFSDFEGVDFGGIGTEEATAYYSCTLGEDVKTIDLKASGNGLKVVTGNEFSVDFSGMVKSGQFSELNESTVLVSSSDVSGSDCYEHNGIIDVHLEGDVLTVKVNADNPVISFGNFENYYGKIIVTIPESYTGSLELDGSVSEIDVIGVSLDNLAFNGGVGEVDIDDCSIQMLTVEKLVGEVDTQRSRIYGVELSDITGEVSINTMDAFTNDSTISDVLGEVSIDLPFGSQLNISRSDVLGEVRIDRSITGGDDAPYMEISDVLGEVTVEIDD